MDILADENYQSGVGKVLAETRAASGEMYDEEEGKELYRVRNKLLHEGVVKVSDAEFSKRYSRIRTVARQAVLLRLKNAAS
jgi:hypothetical protein